MKNSLYRWAPLFGLMIVSTGCSQLMGSLRPDFDDGQASFESAPTVGGRWSERGFLDESMPEGGRGYFAGHNERAPASMRNAGGGDNWVDSTRDQQNQRDRERNAEDGGNVVSYSNTPNMPPAIRRHYKNGSRATRADFIDESPNEGSLWASDGQTNYYFTKNKIRGVGDIVTVNLEDDIIRDLGIEVRRTLNDREKELELALAEERAQARAAGADKAGKTDAVSTSQAAPAANAVESAKTADGQTPVTITPGDIDVAKSLEVKAGDTMMAEIIERYPNGNYKIRGTKKLIYKNGTPRLVNLVGVVKGSDIAEDDTVPSGKLYEYRLEAVR